MFILLRTADYVATIRGRRLFEVDDYSKKYGIHIWGKSMNEASLEICQLIELSITELT